MLMTYFLIFIKQYLLILFFTINDLSIFFYSLLFFFFISFYFKLILQNNSMNIKQFYEMIISMSAFLTTDSQVDL